MRLYGGSATTLWHYHGFSARWPTQRPDVAKAGKELTVRIEVEDFAGNVVPSRVYSCRGQYTVTRGHSPATLGPYSAHRHGAVRCCLCSYDKSSPPDVSLDPDGRRALRHWVRGDDGWQAWFPAAADADVIWIRDGVNSSRTPATLGWKSVSGRDGGLVTSEDGHATLTCAPGDIYVSQAFTLSHGTEIAMGALTPLYTLSPRSVPLARDMTVSIAIPATDIAIEKLGNLPQPQRQLGLRREYPREGLAGIRGQHQKRRFLRHSCRPETSHRFQYQPERWRGSEQ